MAPLRRAWDEAQTDAELARQTYDAASNRAEQVKAAKTLTAIRDRVLTQLREIKVLDPACGSGNFLYMSLRALLDLEKEVILYPAWNGDGFTQAAPEVHPAQMYGIEINPIAHDLATIVVWIGWIQWKINNGYPSYPEPILKDLGENIKRADAILAFDEDGNPVEPAWEPVDVIVGNPPYLGGSLIRGELSEKYQKKLWNLYENKLPGFSDLVCYWFERARAEIEQGSAKRAGLLATSSIRGGANREVLKRIKETGNIFMAWADREWVLDGAGVRVSMIGFDNAQEQELRLDGRKVQTIYSDLTGAVDITEAKELSENESLSYQGASQKGPFDISKEIAKDLLKQKNKDGSENTDVIRPVMNASDLVRNNRGIYSIYFPANFSEIDAANYEAPFKYVEKNVKPVRATNNRASYRERWWLFGEARPTLMEQISSLERYIATPAHAKHRIFSWLDRSVVPTQALILFMRPDDYFFGVLHSKLHEVWSLRMGTSLEDRPRYTPTTTFETFPFPWTPGAEDTDAPEHAAISAAAAALHDEREAWLHPEGVSEKKLRARTLTNLYNALAKWRDPEGYDGKTKPAADLFAPRLAELHDALDRAVCAAYGWESDVLEDEEEILRRLLALNLERAGDE